MPNYTNAEQTSINKKLGEHPSVFDFGAKGDGVTDDGPAFNKGIISLAASGGGTLWIPGGYTFAIGTNIKIPAGTTNLTLAGDGESSIILRVGDFSGSYTGVIYVGVGCNFISFYNFLIDGQVVTPVGLQYGTGVSTTLFDYNPIDMKLTNNTSIFVDGLSSNITMDGVTIQHTGGYSIMFFAYGGFIQNATVRNSTFRNNRPHLFGTTIGDLNYGSWTGGVFCEGDASTGPTATCVINNFTIDGCTFERNTGNCSWTHAHGVLGTHTNVKMTNNTYIDCGLDAITFQVITGGVRSHNTLRRIGYICLDDISPSTPKFLPNFNATGIDSGGIVSGVTTSYNSVTSVYGGFIDMDGCQDEVVSNNMLKLPLLGDLEYTQDSIATLIPNVSYGVNTGNSNGILTVGRNLTITGNLIINTGAGGIKLDGCPNAIVSGNNIQYPDAPGIVPILITNLASTFSINCSITGNIINWNPSSTASAIQETSAFTGIPWTGSQKNWVGGNSLFGNCTEFTKDPTSGSVTGVLVAHSTTGASSAGNFSEGLSFDGANLTIPGTAAAPGLTVVAGYIVSAEGFASVSTSVAVNAPLGTVLGKYVTAASGFYFGGLASPPPNPGVGNAAMYYDTTLGLRVNLSNAGWTSLGGGGTPGGPANSIQFNNGGAFGGVAGFNYTITGGILSNPLFYSTKGTGNFTDAFSTLGQEAHITGNGDIFGQSGNFNAAVSKIFNANVVGLPAGSKTFQNSDGSWTADYQGNIAAQTYKAGTVFNSLSDISGSPTTTAAFQTSTGTFTIFGNGAAQFHSVAANSGIIGSVGVPGNLIITASSNAVQGLNIVTGFAYADGGFATNSASVAFNAPNGTVFGKFVTAVNSLIMVQTFAPAPPTVGQCEIYMNGSNQLVASVNGNPAVNLLGAAGSVAGANTQVQVNVAGSFGAYANLTYSGVVLTSPQFYSSRGTGTALDAFSTLSQEAHITGNGDIFGQTIQTNTGNIGGSTGVGTFNVNGEIDAQGAIRLRAPTNCGFLYCDGGSIYILTSTTANGGFSGLRPFIVDMTSGLVTMLNSLSVTSNVNVSGNVVTSGPTNAVYANDRNSGGGGGTAALYRDFGITRIYDSSFGDIANFSSTGGIPYVQTTTFISSASGSTNAFVAGGGAATITGAGNVACQDMSSNTIHLTSGGSHLLLADNGAGAIQYNGNSLLKAGDGISSFANGIGGGAFSLWLTGLGAYGAFCVPIVSGTQIQLQCNQIALGGLILAPSGSNLIYNGQTLNCGLLSAINQNLSTGGNVTHNSLTISGFSINPAGQINTNASIASSGIINGGSLQNNASSFFVNTAGQIATTGITSFGGIQSTGFSITGGSNGINSSGGPGTPVVLTHFIFVGGICTFAS